jgi:hypothetical protein
VSDGAINAWAFGVVTVLVALWAWSGAATGRWPPATAPFMSVAAAPSPEGPPGEAMANPTRRPAPCGRRGRLVALALLALVVLVLWPPRRRRLPRRR